MMLCPTCEVTLLRVSRSDDILQCPECKLFYDQEGKLLCGACYTYADAPDGWCKDCRHYDFTPAVQGWMSREDLVKLVRLAWIDYCKEIGDTKPSHIASWNELSEQDKEADRRIGDAVVAAYRKWDESMWLSGR